MVFLFQHCVDNGDCGVGLQWEGNTNYFNEIYVKPYTRCPPFLIGLATSYLLHYLHLKDIPTKNKYVKIHPLLVTSGFLLSGFLMLSTVYGTYHSNTWNQKGFKAMSYDIFSRTGFTLGVAIMVLLFSLGYGGVIKRILSFSFWDPFAKLTYGAYLIHPVVIRVYYFSQPSPLSYTDLNISYWFISNMTIAYIIAVFSYLLIEKPFMNLEALLPFAGRH